MDKEYIKFLVARDGVSKAVDFLGSKLKNAQVKFIEGAQNQNQIMLGDAMRQALNALEGLTNLVGEPETQNAVKSKAVEAHKVDKQ